MITDLQIGGYFMKKSLGVLLFTAMLCMTLDQYCRSVHQKYLPLNKVEYTDEIAHKYELCPVCCIHP